MQKTRSGFKIISEDQLDAEHQFKKRIQRRLIAASAFCLLGLIFMIMACFPLILNQAMPIFWVNEADQLGLTKNLREIGLRLLANGRIETLPPAFSWAMVGVSGTMLWVAHLFYINKKEQKWYGKAFSLSYWTTFYPVSQSVTVHRIQANTKGKATAAPQFVFKDPSQT